MLLSSDRRLSRKLTNLLTVHEKEKPEELSSGFSYLYGIFIKEKR
ncbi:hypothetical protein LEP1GSC058_3114 [Leptospira fainei serovar Hurstbridge str. BUT 6]|uniref:Uncharacterized protein n=1 Tax=Leptospira fainei serovar Hurstbridge str. BUT 6 TaxID=1193011 RepID=S3VC72_9LEPT|nr:hypothetical protein LEP1GSC058_3114 [Leptospira fainei serovar Hurstbridge str. BUT 6]